MSMKESNHMQVKVWTTIGITMLVSFITLGLFAFPIGIPVCSVIEYINLVFNFVVVSLCVHSASCFSLENIY